VFFKVFYVKDIKVQLLVDNRSDSTKMHGATIRFMVLRHFFHKTRRSQKHKSISKMGLDIAARDAFTLSHSCT